MVTQAWPDLSSGQLPDGIFCREVSVNILDVVRSSKARKGAEFGKGPDGPWFKILPDGMNFQATSIADVSHPKGLLMRVEDFDRDTWQFRPEKRKPVELMDRVDSILTMLRNVIKEAVDPADEVEKAVDGM